MVVGGLGRHVYQLATALAADGHEVVVLSPPPDRHRPEHPPDHRRGPRGRAGDRRRAGSARVRLRPRHDGLDAGHGSFDDPRRAGPARQGTGSPTWCTPTTGWSPTRRSRWPNSSTCHWFPRSTPPRRGGTPAGCRAGSADRCTPSSRGWSRDSDSLITCSASMRDEITELFGPGLAEITVIRNGIDSSRWPFARAAATPGHRNCCSSAGWSTRRASTTPSPRCPGSGAPIPEPR